MNEGKLISKRMTLSELVTIQAGHPFRGTIPAMPNGEVKVIQAKDISDLGELHTKQLITTDLTGKRQPDWLKQGDILFSAKGGKHIACCIEQNLDQTISGPSLFLLQLQKAWQDQVNPAFLSWQLNQQPVQQYLKRSAEGHFHINIRKPVLAATPIVLPSLATQNAIAQLYRASLKEQALLSQLIHNRQQQLHAIATDLIKASQL